jgi:squalene synthase HpnC
LLRRKERAENFPVALRILPHEVRGHLRAVYAVVRVIDDLGDEAEGDRTALLEDFAANLTMVWRGGTPQAAVLRRLVPAVRVCGLDQEPFDRLIQANLWDQKVSEYDSYADLLAYCKLSAEPIGRIVLTIFGASSPDTVELSDRICTALQLLEHWQDVAEDRRAGRTYLPREDLDAFGVAQSHLDAASASPALRRLIAFEVERAAVLLDSGTPLISMLHGWARLAVAGYVAGGRAAVDGLRRADGEVLARSPGTSRLDLARHLTGLLWRGAMP